MATDDVGDDAWVAANWPNLDKTFIDRINGMIGRMKGKHSGNGFVKIPFSGGRPGKPEWFMKISEPDTTEDK